MVDPRNKLNDLSNKEWLKLTKSVWFSQPPPRDELKKDHPATFAETDVMKLIRFFTKRGGLVLDPFCGTGSTLLACLATGRRGVGVELVEGWAEVARQRVAQFVGEEALPTTDPMAGEPGVAVVEGDAREVLPGFPEGVFDFVVTSPPYWRILGKRPDHKTRRERLDLGLETRYSDEAQDLGNLEEYDTFLAELKRVFAAARAALNPAGWMAVIASDFRHGSRFIVYHADLVRLIEEIGFSIRGITILVQNNKNLYPYGMPYSFVSNINHQNILIFKHG